jgi:hypothetical protein
LGSSPITDCLIVADERTIQERKALPCPGNHFLRPFTSTFVRFSSFLPKRGHSIFFR